MRKNKRVEGITKLVAAYRELAVGASQRDEQVIGLVPEQCSPTRAAVGSNGRCPLSCITVFCLSRPGGGKDEEPIEWRSQGRKWGGTTIGFCIGNESSL